MKKSQIRAACLILALILTLLTACSGGDAGNAPEEEVLLPITLNGAEVRVGETTVQALLDKGLKVTWSNENYESIEVDPSTPLEPMSYYTGGSVWVSDSVFAHISFVTEEEAVTLGEAVIARLEFYLYSEDDASVLENIALDGVPVTQWTRDLAGEKFPDWTGDEVMWLHYGLDYKYDLNFDMESGKMTKFSVERTYDVDWSGGEA